MNEGEKLHCCITTKLCYCGSSHSCDNLDSELLEMLPKGTRSLLVQPVIQAEISDSSQKWKSDGFVLVASSNSYAYNNKDRAWVGVVAKKFEGKWIHADL